jgi:hypothetical protein
MRKFRVKYKIKPFGINPFIVDLSMLSLFLNNVFYQDLASHLRLANDNYTALSTEYEHNTMDAPKKVVFSFV